MDQQIIILCFRILLVIFFFAVFLIFGDFQNRKKYYSTCLFVALINISAGYLTYNHALWYYNDDVIFKDQLIIEIINTFVIMPIVAFVFLSKYPFKGNVFNQFFYIAKWVFLFSFLEFLDSRIGGIAYEHGWSWKVSSIFDWVIFSITRLHYSNPFLAFIITFALTAVIWHIFGFSLSQTK